MAACTLATLGKMGAAGGAPLSDVSCARFFHRLKRIDHSLVVSGLAASETGKTKIIKNNKGAQTQSKHTPTHPNTHKNKQTDGRTSEELNGEMGLQPAKTIANNTKHGFPEIQEQNRQATGQRAC